MVWGQALTAPFAQGSHGVVQALTAPFAQVSHGGMGAAARLSLLPPLMVRGGVTE